MKHLSIRSFMAVAVTCLTLFFGLNLQAAPSNLLIQAYSNLEQADHDYKGHRADAMKQIEAAGKELGINIRGDGRGHEKQGVSDEQLRHALELLEQARGELSGKPLRHVNDAIKQIHIALKIK